MSSITISGLNTNAQIKSEDFIPIVNSASLTTYKTTIQSLGSWIQSSGSAVSSSRAVTASFAFTSLSATSASWASKSFASTSSSFASQSISSSNAQTASWAAISIASTSSSFASKSFTSTSSSFALQSINATSSSWAPFQSSASWASQSISASYAKSSSVASSLIPNNTYPVTASWAVNTVTQRSTITFLSAPVRIASGTAALGLTKYTGNLIPSWATGVILQAYATNYETNSPGFIQITNNAAGNGKMILIGYMSSAGGDGCNYAGQGFFPVSSSAAGGFFWYTVTQSSNQGWAIDIVGYF